jgi:hypothetical protein
MDLYYQSASGGPVEVRNYYLDGSAFVNAGSASAASIGLSGTYHAVAPSLPGSGNPYAFPSDTGLVDLGFHWWAVPNVVQP